MPMDRTNMRGRLAAGFTIIELMIVIAIIVALGAMAALLLSGQKGQADKDIASVEIRTFRNAIDLFKLNFGRVPTDQEGLRVLWDKSALSADADGSRWTGYLKEPKPNDPWQSPWQYRSQTEHGSADGYDLWSMGPDKQDGTDDDITSWTITGTGGDPSGSGSDAPPPSVPPPSPAQGGGSTPR